MLLRPILLLLIFYLILIVVLQIFTEISVKIARPRVCITQLPVRELIIFIFIN